jgi:hypothetical protein
MSLSIHPQQSPKDVQIKEEPFEELFFAPETILQANSETDLEFIERNELEGCCLCTEGRRLQQQLVRHIQDEHFSDGKLGSFEIFLAI